MGIQSSIADLANLKRLAEAIHGKGTTIEMLNRWAAFESACKPNLILALIAENERIAQFEGAYKEWSDKSEWVQESCHWSELGMHRADVMRGRLDKLKAENEELRKDAERYRWLRDSSESINQFYLSTPIWFTGVKFSKANVDSTIDAAMSSGEHS